MEYSKGPWRDSGCRMETATRKGKDGNILVVHGDVDEVEPIIAEVLPKGGNASLIIAAPDLLEACEKAFAQLLLIQTVGSQRGIKKGEVDSSLSLCALRDAIDKAKGGG